MQKQHAVSRRFRISRNMLPQRSLLTELHVDGSCIEDMEVR